MKKFFEGNISLSSRPLGFIMVLFALLVWGYVFALQQQQQSFAQEPYTPPLPVKNSAKPLKSTTTPYPAEVPDVKTVIPAVSEDQSIKTYTSIPTSETYTNFESYAISYPASWGLTSVKGKYGTTLTLQKNGYEFRIYQAGVDGINCVFKDSEVPKNPAFADFRTAEYKQLAAKTGNLRRVKHTWNPNNKNTTQFYVCQEVNGKYQHFEIGNTSYTVPKEYDESIIAEMDTIVVSIEKLQ